MNNYVPYHVHTMYSNGVTNIDSVTSYDQYVSRAAECGMTAIAFSEHGSVFSWLKKKEAVEKAGMKYIHAEEFYLTESLDEKVRDNYHCVLIAKNIDGVRELNRLSSEAFRRDTNNFYYTPRLSMDRLFETSDNIIVTTACLASALNRGTDSAKEKFLSFLITNKHRCFLEIQHHIVEDQVRYNQMLWELSKEFGIPLITGTDTHCLNDEHQKARLMMQRAKDVHFADEEQWDLTFKTYDELVDAYKRQDSLPMNVVLEAIENTNRMADMVEPFEVDRSYKYPHLWKDSEGELWKKINDGIEYRGIKNYPNYKEYEERINYEFSVYKHNGAIDFILLMADIIEFCRANDIEIGWGRGSVNGSVICWLLQITQMDSIKHKLSFERFMNTERVSLADIDTDFPPSRRDEVKEYIVNRKGLYCCDIITFNTVVLKGAIRDICRGLYKKQHSKKAQEEIDFAIKNNGPGFTAPTPTADEEDKEYLQITNYICDNVEANEAKMRKEYPEVFEYVDLVNGVIVSTGSHPCGMVVSATPLDGDMGLCTNSNDPYPISQIYMKEIDSLNYVKLDLLALDTIEVIANTCRLAEIPMVTPDNLDVDDDNVWRSMREDTTSVFQWEGSTGNDYIKKLMSDKNIKSFKQVDENVDRMTLLTIGNSAIRPAGASYRDDLANGVVRRTGSKAIDDFLSDTFGYLVFQEQIIFFLNKFCGFTMGEADIVRRGFAKKTGTEQFIPRIKDGFIKTCVEEYGIPKEKAENDIVAFLQVINDASAYLFSLNHSAPYSYEGYAEGWLRYYYPLEFITTALNNCVGKEEKTSALTAYAKKVGIPILSPLFRHSKADYFCDKEERKIYKGIGSVKFMNAQIADEMYALRDSSYSSFTDLLYDLREKTSINSRQLDILIKLDFFSEFGSIAKLEAAVVWFDKLSSVSVLPLNKIEKIGVDRSLVARHSGKMTSTRIEEFDVAKWAADTGNDVSDCIKPRGGYSTKRTMKKFGLSELDILPYATKVVIGRFSDIDNRGLLKEIESGLMDIATPVANRIRYQREYLGYIDLTVPTLNKRYVVVTNIDTRYSPKFTAYCLSNGQTCEMRIHSRRDARNRKIKTTWKMVPLQEGDVIYMIGCENLPRQKKTDEGWVDVPGEFVWWVNEYKKIDLTI